MMRIFLAVLLVCISVVFAIESTEEVLVLGEDNFDEELQLHDAMLVKFYAPWCPHSQALAPEWEKAAEQLASSPIRIAKVDGTENEDLAKKYEIGAYPTIKYFRQGKVSDFKGGRTAPEIVAWALRKFAPKAHVLNTEEDLTQFQEKNELFSLGVFNSLETDAAKGYQVLADDDEGHVYAITTNPAIKAKLFFPRKVSDKEFVIVFKPFDELRADLPITGRVDLDKISNFIRYQSTPPVQEFSHSTMRRISQSPIKYHVLFFTDKTAAHHDDIMATYTEVSIEFRNKLLFINVPATEAKVLSYFNITTAALPAMLVADFSDKSKGMKPFRYAGTHNIADISTFLQSVLDGKAEPSDAVGSGGSASKGGEAVTAADTQGDVVVVRSASYEEIVLNSDKHVLLEFYAPWCGHCKNLAPIYEELGARMRPRRADLTIAKIDYTANEVAVTGAEITGFPTVLLFKRGQKNKPVVYKGSRELMAFAAFLEEETGSGNSIRREL